MQPYFLMLQADADDRFITEETMAAASLDVSLKFLNAFDELSSFIAIHGMPCLFLVNEQNGKYSALEILKALKQNPDHALVPSVVLSEKMMSDYIQNCYAAGTASVIVKPSSLQQTHQKIHCFFQYWLQVAELNLQTNAIV